jgi:cell shape-determining protein MreC
MSSELDQLRRKLEEVKRLREEEQRRREEEQQYYEQRTGKTNLAEFINACYVHLYQRLTVQDES